MPEPLDEPERIIAAAIERHARGDVRVGRTVKKSLPRVKHLTDVGYRWEV